MFWEPWSALEHYCKPGVFGIIQLQSCHALTQHAVSITLFKSGYFYADSKIMLASTESSTAASSEPDQVARPNADASIIVHNTLLSAFSRLGI